PAYVLILLGVAGVLANIQADARGRIRRQPTCCLGRWCRVAVANKSDGYSRESRADYRTDGSPHSRLDEGSYRSSYYCSRVVTVGVNVVKRGVVIETVWARVV